MYYILNETNKIIAADESVLNLCGVTHIDELASSIIKGDIIFDLTTDEHMLIKTEATNETYTLTKTSLSSMLGMLTLVTLSSQDKKTESLLPIEDTMISSSIEDDINNIDIINSPINSEDLNNTIEENISKDIEINDDIASLILEDTDNVNDKPITFDNYLSPDNDDGIMHLSEEETKVETKTEEVVEDEPLEFKLDNADIFLEKEEIADLSEININVEEISQKIGISTDDYNTFLDDFIDTALALEKDLQSDNHDTRLDAIGTLSHLAEVLHLPVIGDILTTITQVNNDNPRNEVESLYSTLSRLTTSVPSEKEVVEEIPKEAIIDEDIPEVIEEEKIELFETPEIINEPVSLKDMKSQKISKEKSFGTISLEDIKPKHFDFQLEEAANDLSLPVELIEEFVHDFIDQAHTETKKMLNAYEEGDLDTIQKIGHLLKGAASNLRINPLSDTLYKIQFCEDANNLETLIKDYWAHFLSFETQINVISN